MSNKCQIEKYNITIWANKIRSINLISSQMKIKEL